MDVVVVIRGRERWPAELEQGDDLRRLKLGREGEDLAEGTLGHAARLLVSEHRHAVDSGDVHGLAKSVRGGDARAGVVVVAADQAGLHSGTAGLF